ncbi:hypothetical protein BH23GEM9_BH23GEM9_26820 [soil metagenome]
MRIDPPVTPWDEPPSPLVFRAPVEFVDADNEDRLIPILRAAAKTRNPITILAWSATEFVKANRAVTADTKRAAADLGTALADLAVTGRESYRAFQLGLNIVAVEGATRQRVEARVPAPAPTDEEIGRAMEQALDRAYDVAWALRGPLSIQVELRPRLGWIAVSSEDDTAHRPVNMPAPPFEQYEVDVTARLAGGNRIVLSTRYFVACAEPVPSAPVSRSPRTAPNDPIPNIPSDHEVLLFIHGHSSGAEEALDIIPHLIEQGLPDRKYAVISFDLPNNGYSQTFDHTRVALPNATTFPLWPSDNDPIAVPLLDFIEDFVVAFVDDVERVAILNGRPGIQNRIAAVFGGSLGGNLTLRLGRRRNAPPWLKRAFVAWSPASVWKAMVKHNPYREGPRYARDMFNEPETDDSRARYFNEVYERDPAPIVLKRQSAYWYRKGFPTTELRIAMSRLARREIYNEFYRIWHWRVACEQLTYSHAENEVYGDSSTPVRYTLNRVRTLLVAGAVDNYTGTGIYNATRTVGKAMTKTPGRLLLLRDTGHSIHTERPQYFATEIVKFLAAKVMEIRCVVRVAGRIERVGGFDHTQGQPFNMSQQECIAAITRGDDYFVVGPAGDVAAVIVGQIQGAPGPGGTTRYFIKTEADGLEPNNLASLPQC